MEEDDKPPIRSVLHSSLEPLWDWQSVRVRVRVWTLAFTTLQVRVRVSRVRVRVRAYVMDLTFPLCENSKALSPLKILQEQYTNLQAKVLAVPLPSPIYGVFHLCL
jgi:hypothetical protein